MDPEVAKAATRLILKEDDDSDSLRCKATLAALETKLGDSRQRKIEIEVSIRECAFAAHTDTGSDARQRLSELHDRQTLVEQDLRSLEAAMGEARCRLQAAQAAELDADEIAKAKRALALCSAFAARGEALDRSLSKFLDDFRGLSSDFNELTGVGYGPGSWPLVTVNMRNAMIAKLMFTDLEVQHLEEVINGWANSVRMRAERRLAKNENDKAA